MLASLRWPRVMPLPVTADGDPRDADPVARGAADLPPRRCALHVSVARGSSSRAAEATSRFTSRFVRLWCKLAPAALRPAARPRAELDRAAKEGGHVAEAALEREVLLNVPRVGGSSPQQHASYAGNKVVTAKYNLLTFLPRFGAQMFSRVAYMCAPLLCAATLGASVR